MNAFPILILLAKAVCLGLLVVPSLTQADEAHARFEAADRLLNETYSRVIKGLSAEASVALRKSEKAWIAFRDADAAFAASRSNSGEEASLNQKSSDTEERTAFLREFFSGGGRTVGDPDSTGLAYADHVLNEEYRQAMAALVRPAQDAFRATQRAWVATRDADLMVLRSIGAIRGNSPSWAFLRDRTEQRVATIRRMQRSETPIGGHPPSLVQRPIQSPSPNPPTTRVPALPASMVGRQLRVQIENNPEEPFNLDAPKSRREQITTQVDPGRPIRSIALDMRANLLIGVGEDSVRFWDTQTGGLIQSVALASPEETEEDASGEDVWNLGEGHVAAVLHHNKDFKSICLYSHNTSASLHSAGMPRGDFDFDESRQVALAEECGKFAVLGNVPLLRDQGNDQSFLLGARSGKTMKFIIPTNPDKPWHALALAVDGNSAAVASEDRVLIVSIPEGKIITDASAPPGKRLLALIANPKAGGFIACTDSGELLRVVPGDPSCKIADQLPLNGNWQGCNLIGTRAGWVVATFWGKAKEATTKVASGDAPPFIRELLSRTDTRLLTIDREGKYAAVERQAGQVDLYHLASGLAVRTFGTPTPSKRLVEISGDGKTLVACHPVSANMVEVNTVAIDQLRHRTFVVKAFDQLLGIDDSGTRLVVYRKRGEKFQPRFESSRWLFVPPGTSQLTLGIVDLRTGETVDRRVTVAAESCYFSPAANLLIGMETGKEGSEIVLTRFLEANMHLESRIQLKKVVPPDFRISPESISLSSNRRKLSFVSAERDRVVVLDITKPTDPIIVRDYGSEPIELARGATTQFSQDGTLLAVIQGAKLNDYITVFDTRQSGKALWSRGFGIVDSPQFSADGRRFIFGERLRRRAGIPLTMLDATTGRSISTVTLQALHGSENTRIASNGTRAVVEGGGHGRRIVEVKAFGFVETARFALDVTGNYALVLSNGYYLATGRADRLISFAESGRSQPAESLDIKYNRPDLVAKELGAAPELVQAFRQAYEKRLARMGIDEKDLSEDTKSPVAAIDYNKIPLTTSERMLRLPAVVKPGGAPLVALEVTVNDVPVLGRDGRALIGADTRGFAGEIEIELARGSNKITVWGRDAKGMTSSRVSVNVTSTAKSQRLPTLYVLAVGINEYLGEIPRLSLAHKDATDVAEFFAQNRRSQFSEVKVKLLLDRAATRRGILDARAFFAEAGVNDQIIIFMSAHGVLDAEYNYRFCSTDTDLKRLPETTLSFPEIEGLMEDCRARKRLVLLDTCHAGEPDRDDPRLAELRVPAAKGVRSVPFQPVAAPGVHLSGLGVIDLLERHFVDLRIGAGAAVLSSSTAQQQSLEAAEVSNGLFTAAVLTGLRHRSADRDGDGIVRVSELLQFCQEEVRRLSDGMQDPVSRHVNLADDFPVVSFH